MPGIIETITKSLEELLRASIIALPGIITAIIIVFLTRYLVQFFDRLTEKTAKRTLRSASLQILLRKAVTVGVWSVGIVLACVSAFPDFELGDIVATLGIGSVAVGFAFQDIFKNFLAGIILLAEEPFSIGDEIVVGEYQGIVKYISIRTTQIRTYQGEKVLIPNSSVFTNSVKVLTAYTYRRTDLSVGVDYNTPLTEAKNILAETIEMVQGVISDPKPKVELVNFGDSSIDFVIRYWTLPEQKEVNDIQSKAIIAIKKACDEASINIPYPIRTIYYYDQEKYNDYIKDVSSSI
ncbi:MAG: mechanosensitive ion channel family protein [Xenococcaceae cyanobacterium MO_234.B1]|nr:mechanosensitive ion channel family protein [Xenococcaceae cyanobacterium MO_234.B1]